MSATKIVHVDFLRGTRIVASLSRERGSVIDRSDFYHWIKKPLPVCNNRMNANSRKISETMSQIYERVGRLRAAYKCKNYADIITQSARISILSAQLGLPRTAKLAADIGEAQMAGENMRAFELIEKLDGIISALSDDLKPDPEPGI